MNRNSDFWKSIMRSFSSPTQRLLQCTATLAMTGVLAFHSAAQAAAPDITPLLGTIEIEDSVAPTDDLTLDFGTNRVGQTRTETITIHNTHGSEILTVTGIRLGDSGSAAVTATATSAPDADGNLDPVETVAPTVGGDEKPTFTLSVADGEEPEYLPGQLLIGFDNGIAAAARTQTHAAMGATPVNHFSLINVDLVEVSDKADLQKFIDAYLDRPGVRFAEPNYRVHLLRDPNDIRYTELWGMPKIEAPASWRYTVGSHDVIVAVVDTGIDYNHPELAPNMWVNPSPTIGDVHGARWTSGNGFATSGNPMDDQGHGTHVAGTIGAVGDNVIGVAGVAWNVRLMALKFLDHRGFGTSADAIAAIQYSVNQGAHISNNSWGGGPYSQALKNVIDAAAAANQLFVAAAGNYAEDNDVFSFYPANYDCPNIISVASQMPVGGGQNERLSSFSNYGKETVHLAAPGSDILSTLPKKSYDSFSGTSMAAPHVAGVAALLRSVRPDAAYNDLKHWILDSVNIIPNFEDLLITGGTLNARAAMERCNPYFTIENPPAFPSHIAPGSSLTVNIRYTAHVAGTQANSVHIDSSDTASPSLSVNLIGRSVNDTLQVERTVPNAFISSGFPGGPFSPMQSTYRLTNTGNEEVAWSASIDENWAGVAPESGVIPAGQNVNITVALNSLANDLSSGYYGNALSVSNATTDVVQRRSTALHVRIPLCVALDNCDLVWSTGASIGSQPWFAQDGITWDGVDAAQSGRTEDNGQSYLLTHVRGPGELRFRWRVSSERNYDFLSFWVDGVKSIEISGETSWALRTYTLSEEKNYQLVWLYEKDREISGGMDAGWVDQVEWIPEVPVAPPMTPELENPLHGEADVSLTPMLVATAFMDTNAPALTHANTHWQISRNAAFTDLAWDSSTFHPATTQVRVPGGRLAFNTVYFVRLRYRNSSGRWSEWSPSNRYFVSITSNIAPNTPVLASPINGLTGVSLTPMLTANAFSDPDPGDFHVNSQWQISRSSDFSSLVWDSGPDSPPATATMVPSGKLEMQTRYHWRVRYRDSRGGWSAWALAFNFTTLEASNPPETPTLQSPSYGAMLIPLTPTLVASHFFDIDGHAHANSQWQIAPHHEFSTLVWDSGTTFAGTTQTVVPGGVLRNNTYYFWRVRYRDSSGAWSAWSAWSYFKTQLAAVGRYNDFNQNGATDLAVYETRTGNWYIRPVGPGAPVVFGLNWGNAGMVPVPGDFSGNGTADLAVYETRTSRWFIRPVGPGPAIAFGPTWGGANVVPVSGDFNGNGRTDLAVYNYLNGNWRIRPVDVPAPIVFDLNWGSRTMLPVPGNYNGDTRSDLAVYEPGTGNWYIRPVGPGAPIAFGLNWGAAGMIPVSGDFSGNGVSDLAMYDPRAGNWFIRPVGPGGAFVFGVNWGGPGFIPVSGDFNGDGIDDLAVYEIATGNWYIRSLGPGMPVLAYGLNWGTPGMLPVRLNP